MTTDELAECFERAFVEAVESGRSLSQVLRELKADVAEAERLLLENLAKSLEDPLSGA